MSEKIGAIMNGEYDSENFFEEKPVKSGGGVREKLAYYLNRGRRRKMNSELAKGYGETAEVNLTLAEDGISSDNQALKICEQKLAESECCDS